jgi:hypothetical protein
MRIAARRTGSNVVNRNERAGILPGKSDVSADGEGPLLEPP